MDRNSKEYRRYAEILHEELIPSAGCTDPVAVAYCAGLARAALGELPEQTEVAASGNIIKNVKSVTIPNTGGLRGIEAAAASGVVAGNADRLLEVLSGITDEGRQAIRTYMEERPVRVTSLESNCVLDIVVTVQGGGHSASARIAGGYTNVVRVERDGQVLRSGPEPGDGDDRNWSCLNVRDIVDFIETVELEEIAEPVRNQIACNMALAKAGMEREFGANVGKVLSRFYGDGPEIRARAMASAAADARMNGCELPAVILTGSGNQGITASVPVAVWAEHLGCGEERLIRAVALADLLTVRQKVGIGVMSAFCGAVCAGCSAGAAIAWLQGGGYEEVSHALVNSLAVLSGMVCDGAKSSCAGKIALAVEAGLLGYHMYQAGQEFKGGDGIVTKGVEATMVNVGRLATDGMRETDREIIKIMVGE